jgi:prolyl 4-hydroxylase
MQLNKEWEDWIKLNLERGCLREDMVKAMTGSGFKAEAAAFHIEQVANGVQRYEVSNYLSLTGNRIALDDHECALLFHCSDPEIACFADFLSAAECEELIARSAAKLENSTVVDNDTGDRVPHAARTSQGTWFRRQENEFIARIEHRIALLTGSKVSNGEGLQILHYGIGGRYDPHYDYFSESVGGKVHQENGGQRVATFIMYLNDVDAGGETIFPHLRLKFAPRRGNALYFSYTNDRGQLDDRSLHGGAPVSAGEKWISTKWIRIGEPAT